MRELTKAQYFALVDLDEARPNTQVTPYNLGRPVTAFRSLAKMGFAECMSGSRAHSIWRITAAGRLALRAAEEKHDA
jgi:hypothetical protein